MIKVLHGNHASSQVSSRHPEISIIYKYQVCSYLQEAFEMVWRRTASEENPTLWRIADKAPETSFPFVSFKGLKALL